MNQVLSVINNRLRFSSSIYIPIAENLEKVEGIIHEKLSSNRPGVAEMIKHLDYYRGKRLRPTLLLLVAKACGQINHAHLVLGAVVEMIHTATLVHDDVLDDADTRRHISTVNGIWGNQASILLGDYLFTQAFHLTSTIGDAHACEIIGNATNRVCEGELHQICRRGKLNLREDEYFSIIDAKTAELTACCCLLGAFYSGRSKPDVESLSRFGRYLGMAFQIADDLLDILGQEEKAGKSLGTDIKQQKMTLPLIHLLQNSKQAAALRDLLQSEPENIREKLLPQLHDCGSIEYSRKKAEHFARLAKEELSCLDASDSLDILELLAEKVVNREA